MTFNHSIGLYSELFNGIRKDYDYYKRLYSSPVHPTALLSIMEVNSESIMTSVIQPDVGVIEEMYVYGKELLSDAIGYRGSDQNGIEEETLAANGASRQLQIDGLNDNGNAGVAYSVDDGDEGDLTELQGDNGSTQISITPSTMQSKTREFEHIDDELRMELVINIVRILQVWHQSMSSTNKKQYAKMNSLGSNTTSDLTIALSQVTSSGNQTHESTMAELLNILRWYLTKLFKAPVPAPHDSTYLLVVREIFVLLVNMLQPLFLGVEHYDHESFQCGVFKSLISNFFLVDLSDILDSIMTVTLNQYDETADGFVEPPIRLSTETLLRLYALVGVLSRITPAFLPITAAPVSSDITSIGVESSNPYDKYLESRKFDIRDFQSRFSSRLIPLLAIDFKYYYKQYPDILQSQITNSSFINWITGNRFNHNSYVKYDTANIVTNLETNFANLTLTQSWDESHQKELLFLESERLHRSTIREEVITLNDLLPITLYLYSHTKNFAFLNTLSTQFHTVSHRIEDLAPEEDLSIELLEIWLCLLSYNYQNQHSSIYMQNVSKISLLILLKLTSNYQIPGEHDHKLAQNIKSFQINEFKWKIAHQKAPIVPLDVGDDGFKSCSFYILDCLQVFFRFNMTKKLNIQNFRFAANVMQQILEFIYTEKDISLESYNWSELYRTLLSILVFIDKHNLVSSKFFDSDYQRESLKSFVEEIATILDFMLSNKFSLSLQLASSELVNGSTSQVLNSINFHLVYSILLNYKNIDNILNVYDLKISKYLSRLHDCLDHFKVYFSSEGDSNIEPLVFDSDSPLLNQKITDYLDKQKENPGIFQLEPSNTSSPKHRYKQTFTYVNKHYKDDLIGKEELLDIFNMLLALNFKQI